MARDGDTDLPPPSSKLGVHLFSLRFRPAPLLAIALTVSSCSTPESPDQQLSSRAVSHPRPTPHEPGPSALVRFDGPSLPDPLIDATDLFHTGIAPDEIAPVDEPRVERARDVDWLDDDEPVVALSIEGEHRAYPVQILVWHEIVNDTLGDVPIAVTYCPLCNAAVTVGREVGRRVLTFGVSGFLFRSALVMYDRQTESLWTQFDREAVAGRLIGTLLQSHPTAMVAWRDFREAHGDRGTVLSRDTGFERDYGASPYTGYDGVDDLAVVVWWRSGLSSALDAERVADGRDVGATGVSDATVAGRELTFRAEGHGFVDDQTGSRWDVLGHATAGPMAGRRLTPISHLDTFWFAWSDHRPDTYLVAGEA